VGRFGALDDIGSDNPIGREFSPAQVGIALRVLAKDHPHRKIHVARSAFDPDLDQRSTVEVGLHDVLAQIFKS